MIKIENLSKLYQTNKQQVQAVNNVSLNIEKGEIFGVIGYSGAGKSTFIRLINRLEEPTNGTVSIQELDITNMSQAQLRKKTSKDRYDLPAF